MLNSRQIYFRGGVMDFGHTLRVLRISTGTSLRHLAKEVGLSPTYISHIETGKLPPPNQSRISKIEEVLNIPEGALFHLTDRIDEKVAIYLNDIAEAGTFLRTAFDEGMKEEDALASLIGRMNHLSLWSTYSDGLVHPQAHFLNHFHLHQYRSTIPSGEGPGNPYIMATTHLGTNGC